MPQRANRGRGARANNVSKIDNGISAPGVGGDLEISELPLKKNNRIYNYGYSKKPAELFRKDLISAMKMADGEQLARDEYLLITDTWKEEWEKGVQVPVNPDSLPEPNYRCVKFKEEEEQEEEDCSSDASKQKLNKNYKKVSVNRSQYRSTIGYTARRLFCIAILF